MLNDLIAVCGVNCTSWPAFQATRRRKSNEMERVAKEWTDGMKKTVSAEDTRCEDCTVDGWKSAD